MSITSIGARPPLPAQTTPADTNRSEPHWLSDFVAGMTSPNPVDRLAAHTRLVSLFTASPERNGKSALPDPRLQREILAALARETGPGGRLQRSPEAHATYAAVLWRAGRADASQRELATARRLAGGRDPWWQLNERAFRPPISIPPPPRGPRR